MHSEAADPPAPRWRSVLAIWGGVGLFDATQTVVSMQAMGMHHAWTKLFVFELFAWLPWALATPAVMRLAVRRPLRLRWRRGGGRVRTALAAWAVHAACWLALSLGAAAWIAVTEHLLNPWNPLAPAVDVLMLLRARAYEQVVASAFIYYCVVMAGHVLDSRERLAAQRTAAAGLAGRLAQAQLAALRHQVEPHFLFNALNAIAGLVREQRNELAVETIAGVSEFLRHALHESCTQEAALAEELRFAAMYLDIQKLRFGDRLAPRLDVAPGLDRAIVPRLILQPLVENAVKHGIAQRAQPGVVEVRAVRTSAGLELSVYNDGPPIAPGALRERAANDAPAPGTPRRDGSIGLANVRERLRALHGDAGVLEVANVEGRGVLVSVRLPWRDQADARAEADAAPGVAAGTHAA
ncbi:MAG: sensor histidine kinase [Burkholderiaceae bacterium]